jgi:hypothetical protein
VNSLCEGYSAVTGLKLCGREGAIRIPDRAAIHDVLCRCPYRTTLPARKRTALAVAWDWATRLIGALRSIACIVSVFAAFALAPRVQIGLSVELRTMIDIRVDDIGDLTG